MSSITMPVLIVDDDPSIVAILCQVVRQLQPQFVAETTCVGCGSDARAALAQTSFQLVLLDYLLPDEDGLSILAAINEQPVADRPAVIMLTGAGNEQIAVEAMKLGAKDYLLKNALNYTTLRRSIVTALEHRSLAEKLAQSTAELRRKNLELDSDLALARGVQLALLPAKYPVFPPDAAPGREALQFCHRWIPSEKVAGDLFDVFPVGPGAAGVAVFDVMGHGVRAALVTALLRGLVREEFALAERPGLFLAAINRDLQKLLGQRGELIFVTAIYAVIDAASGVVRLANAGHPAPLQLRRESGEVSPLTATDGPGPALGLLADSAYDQFETTLAPGDALLLFTDGIFEAADAAGEEFGRVRLQSVLADRLALPTSLLIDVVLADVRAFQKTSAVGFGDDVCVVGIDLARAEPALGPDH